MDFHPTHRATPVNCEEEASQRLSAGSLDQSLFWKDVRQALLFVSLFVAVGGGAVWFLALPRHVQAMLVYGAILAGCLALILAGLRRRTHGR